MRRGQKMQRTENQLTDVEMIDTLLEIVDMTLSAYDNPVREGFQKGSRCSQIGYDLVRLLLDKKIIKTGRTEGQQRLENT